MFSYGSGLAATMFSFKILGPTGHIAQAANLDERLEERKFLSPQVETPHEAQIGKRHLSTAATIPTKDRFIIYEAPRPPPTRKPALNLPLLVGIYRRAE